jgi:hypothetical protein
MKNSFYYLLILLFVIIGISMILNIEKFNGNIANVDESVNILYPTKNLETICKEKNNSKPAYMPTQCIHEDGTINKNANCECMDKTNSYCTSCYPDIKHIELTSEELNNDFSYMSYK